MDGYTPTDVHGKTVQVCDTCGTPVAHASLRLHQENHERHPGTERADVRHVTDDTLPASGIDAQGRYHCSHKAHVKLDACPWYPCTGAIHGADTEGG